MNPNQEGLFKEMNKAQYGENRHRERLFVPDLLERGGMDQRLQGAEWDEAHKIICKWADMELAGKLAGQKETALEADFITDIFGRALGYTLFSQNKKEWNLERKYKVNGGEADAAIGKFTGKRKSIPDAVIELKGPETNLDRDRFNGRTAIQQCWDYLNALPECDWGIVSNFVSFRLFHRNHTPRRFELFVLQELRKPREFEKFYYLLSYGGLQVAPGWPKPRAQSLLEKSGEQQEKIGDELYESYDLSRRKLILALTKEPFNKPLENAIRIAQKLLDRIIFVAFCEDRNLLPDKSLLKAFNEVPPFQKVTNPKWKNFLALFRSIDEGNESSNIPPFNGGLFRLDDEVDNLDLDDSFTQFFANISKYDFRDQVNVEVLGKFFEKSVHDIGIIKQAGIFEEATENSEKPRMDKSAERKRQGIYYTPPEFTEFMVFNVVQKTIDEELGSVAKKYGLSIEEATKAERNSKLIALWKECFEKLQDIKVVDPACGSGAFLFKAYDAFEERYHDIIDLIQFHNGLDISELEEKVPEIILKHNLYGVDLSPESVEITQLALWIRSARHGKTLSDLSQNIVTGNSLISDKSVDKRAFDWQSVFPTIFDREQRGFDCVIGNPPWERMKLQEREFFDRISPKIASAVNAAIRRKLIEDLKKKDPTLYQKYLSAKESAESALDYVRKSGKYPLTGKGDINMYSVFAELAKSIVATTGRVGILVPSGISSDDTTKEYFGELVDTNRLIAIYDFENRKGIFPDIDNRMKFSIFLFGGQNAEQKYIDTVFFAHRIEELGDSTRHVKLTPSNFKLLNPNTKTSPIFRSARDAELTKGIYKRVQVLVNKDRKELGNPWGVKFLRMFDQTNDAELFRTGLQLKEEKFRRVGVNWKKGKQIYLPLYEAKMVQAYDHRAAGVNIKEENWVRQGQTIETALVQHQMAEFSVEPRWWVDGEVVLEKVKSNVKEYLLGFKDITSATNQRTMIAAAIPWSAVLNHFPLILTDQFPKLELCLLANLNSFVLDFVARQKIGGVTLNFFIVEQLPIFAPDFYSEKCPWNKKLTLEDWISERVLKLTCTSNDMLPLAKAAKFTPPVHKWKENERLDLRAQLDAAYFLFYDLKEKDVKYILSTFSGVSNEDELAFDSGGTVNTIMKYYLEFRSKSKA